jgi:hypothetical protein
MNSRNQAMIPKKQFVKLRKYVLDYLRRNADGNGYCHIQHGSLDKVIMYAQSVEFHPFAGMPHNSAAREQATDIFWQALLNAKMVEVVSAPVTLGGTEAKHYYLPGTKPFHDSTLQLFDEVRRTNQTGDD